MSQEILGGVEKKDAINTSHVCVHTHGHAPQVLIELPAKKTPGGELLPDVLPLLQY